MSSQVVTNVEESTSNHKAISNPNMVKRIHREVRFGLYILGSTLGEGEFGKVKLGWRKDGKHPSQVAIKLIKRDTIMKDSESEIKIHREINSLKMLNHPNIVNLVEVMKSGKYIGIVLEYASGGELFDYILQHKYLKENVAKKLFAQLVSGVDYMHSKGLIHRDLKLENLLLDKHKNVIISDFGFVNSYNKDKNDLMKTSCGSPCYAAPELVLTQAPYEGRRVDTWSLGVILYAMLAGYLPFDDDPENEDGSDIVRLYHYICKTPLTFPEYISPLARDLLRKIIVPDPKKRITIKNIKNHPWLTPYVNLLSVTQPEWDKVHVDNRTVSAKTASTANNSYTNLINSNTNKRFSMINEKTNSSSLIMPAGRSYSSINVVNQLYSNPSAPTTSSSLANVVALSKPKDPTSNRSRTPSPTKQLPNGNNYSSSNYQRGHAKSTSISNPYSSASNALKAMVTENDSKRNSMVSLNSTTSSMVSLSSSAKPNNHLPNPHLPRSTTYTGSAISTIVESPSKPSPATPPAIDNESNASHNYTASSTNISNLKPNSSSRESAKLPHANKKPRPTSYHPSSMSASLMSNNGSSLQDYIKIPTPLLPIPQLLSTSPTKASPSSESSSPIFPETNNSSPTIRSNASINSRRNSVVTHVHVNGVLTSESNANNHENKRNSVLSYLEDKMDALELTELHSPQKSSRPVFPDNTSDTNITPQINQQPMFDGPTESPIIQTKTIEEPQVKDQSRTDDQMKTEELKEEYIIENVDKQIHEDKDANVPLGKEASEAYSENSNLSRRQDQTDQQDNIPIELKEPLQTFETQAAPAESISQTVKNEDVVPLDEQLNYKAYDNVTDEQEKENLDRKTTNTKKEASREINRSTKEVKDNKKRNRFSLLSFYSNYNGSSSSNVVLQQAPASNSSHGGKRILEPSMDQNVPSPIQDQKRNVSNSSGKSSASKKSNNSGTAHASNNNGKEASAARKVMDFFKRRSVRIG